MKIEQPFAGFTEPISNYFPLANDFFNFTSYLRAKKGSQITAELKAVLFLQCHRWHMPNGASERQIRLGIKRGQVKMHSGIGVDKRTLEKALSLLVSIGAIIFEANRYRINIIQQNDTRETSPHDFHGFPPVSENYFKVPNGFLSLIAPIKSAATITILLYMIRHAWGYHNTNGCWMGMQEIRLGRQGAKKYDGGVGFDEATIYHSLQEAMDKRLIMWSDRDPNDESRKKYNLRFVNSEVDEKNCEFLGKFEWESEDDYAMWLDHRGFANERHDFACTTGGFADTNRGYEGSSRKIASASPDFDGQDLRINTLRQKEKHEETTTTTTPSLASIVAAKTGSSLDQLLMVLGVRVKKSRMIALRGRLANVEILAWGMYAWSQKNIKNPIAFLIRVCGDGDTPPPDLVNLVNAPIREVIAKIGYALPPKIAEVVSPYYDEEADETTQIREYEEADQIDEEAQRIWDEVKADLQDLLPRNTYETWIAPSRGISWNGAILIVASKNKFAHDALSRLATEITAALESKIRGSEIKFVVAPPTDY